MWWIKAAIQEYILRSWSLVKMGTTAAQKKLFFNLRKAKGRISALEKGDLRPEQVKQIATQLGVTEQDVVDMNRRLGGDASLNAPLREEGEGEWQDWLVDDSASQETVLAAEEEGQNRLQGPAQRAHGAQPAGAPDLRGAPAFGRAEDAGGPFNRVRRLSRARPPDRGARLRKGSGGRQAQPGSDREGPTRPPEGAPRVPTAEGSKPPHKSAAFHCHCRKASLSTCSPAAPFSMLRIARWPAAVRIGRSIQLRRRMKLHVAVDIVAQVGEADQEQVFAHRHGQARDRRAAGGFLVLELEQALRRGWPGPDRPGRVEKLSSTVCDAGRL